MEKKRALIIVIIIVLAIVFGLLNYDKFKSRFFGGEEFEGTRNYVSRDIGECSRTQILCVEGFEFFSDETGCGCEKTES